ncbi:acetyl-CoA carboxylase biotin carboxyl carrier protein subunit [Spirosoma sordidisoli]|uniref:Biotin/lipoyl-binding protein n=1 Tax=Spirosoma sordidisoli TaxID=2502893 RepID=A0A4Q2URJ1_9BACT|nr:acetyl-CoA carboxylase biotin carboxyl carrier protein subunit [Spirosoma sordidisoli]RYC70325.1 biotin/lipoyl-binding protein [Spirosoma sordidisoli]
MYQTTLDQQPATIDFSATGPVLNGEPFSWDLVRLTDRTLHILYQDRSYNAEVLELNAAAKTVVLKINGRIHTIQLKDRFDLLLEKMGMSSAVAAKIGDLKAPMPGLIVGITVAVGATVQKGDTVLILEAMKMENTIKAPAEATVKAIRVQKGDRVEKGQVLIEFG